MSSGQTDVVIVGGGHAGGVCALALRRFGFRGSIGLVGSETVAPYERPSLSKEMLSRTETEPCFIASPGQWNTLEIGLRLGTRVAHIDREAAHIVLDDGSAIAYRTLVLATGGRPRQLPFARGSARVLSLRTEADSRAIADLARRSQSAILVGGGVIGLEAAASLRTLGLDITIVEAADRLLPRNAPSDVAGWIEQLHQREGNRVLLSRTIVAIEDRGGDVCVTLNDGQVLQADFAIVGIGIDPETDLAGAASLACRNGILVDETYRSKSDPQIFAIGDVAAKVQSDGTAPVRAETWAHAQTSAETAARAICGLPREDGFDAWWWTHQFAHTLQMAGSWATAPRVVQRGERIRLYLAANGAIVAAAMLNAPKEFALARRLIAQASIIDAERAADPAIALRDAVATSLRSDVAHAVAGASRT